MEKQKKTLEQLMKENARLRKIGNVIFAVDCILAPLAIGLVIYAISIF